MSISLGEGLEINLYPGQIGTLIDTNFLGDTFSTILPGINLTNLVANKLYVYQADKKTLAYTFDSVEQAARELTPGRCSHLSDFEISQRKNIRYI